MLERGITKYLDLLWTLFTASIYLHVVVVALLCFS